MTAQAYKRRHRWHEVVWNDLQGREALKSDPGASCWFIQGKGEGESDSWT